MSHVLVIECAHGDASVLVELLHACLCSFSADQVSNPYGL